MFSEKLLTGLNLKGDVKPINRFIPICIPKLNSVTLVKHAAHNRLNINRNLSVLFYAPINNIYRKIVKPEEQSKVAAIISEFIYDISSPSKCTTGKLPNIWTIFYNPQLIMKSIENQ